MQFLEIETSDYTMMDTYNLLLVAVYDGYVYSGNGGLNFTVAIGSPCTTAVITIAQGTFPNIDYEIGSGLKIYSLNLFDIQSTVVNCPAFELTLSTVSDGLLDSTVFNYMLGTPSLEIISNDYSKIGSYDIKLNVGFGFLLTNDASHIFNVKVSSLCTSVTFSISPSIL